MLRSQIYWLVFQMSKRYHKAKDNAHYVWLDSQLRCSPVLAALNTMENSMNKILKIILVSLSAPAWAIDDDQKYRRGDCITPVIESYSWHGTHATVEAYSVIEGFTKEKSYILAFPFNGSNSTIFTKEIEFATKKVCPSLCGK